ncbi:tyrosine-type recombinase/integrase [Chitinilyticum litopenaei]|uniref:tyrosine-type recombinase/integrase n=1 Tax=Chitinilyticum litopenaei TaxID=1121276 RepID=UPI00048B5CB2|nr:integrase arm-type DNA-binding domain-containing protein [Chitinilyticum litopenaei]
MALTKLQADNARPREDGKPLKLSDALGLTLWVMPTGAKYWRWKYRWGGKEKSLALGVYPEVSLKEARQRRDAARLQLAQGDDPSAARKAEKLARQMAARDSFEVVAREWHRVEAAQWAPGHARAVLRTLEIHLFPAIGARPVRAVTSAELLTLLRRIEQTGKRDTAKRLRERCSAIFALAIASGLAESDPAAPLVRALQAPVSKPRAALSREQLPAFLQQLFSTEDCALQTRYLIQVVMICFTRIGETVMAEWAHIDFDKAEWTIPPENRKLKHKLKAAGSPHVVPLPRQVLEIFTKLQKFQQDGNPYVFPAMARKKSRHMSATTPLKTFERMGYAGKDKSNGHIVTHGFRATASTILNEAGFNPDAVERQLSHGEPNQVRAAYNRAYYMPERLAMLQCWADYLDRVLEEGTALPLLAPARVIP